MSIVRIESPFVSGTRVAVLGGHDPRETTVDKVYKTGNFTLVGSPQQWRPSGSVTAGWNAHKTTRDPWSHETLILWDASTNERIQRELGKASRRMRLNAIQDKVRRLQSAAVTDELLTALESALATKPPDIEGAQR